MTHVVSVLQSSGDHILIHILISMWCGLRTCFKRGEAETLGTANVTLEDEKTIQSAGQELKGVTG